MKIERIKKDHHQKFLDFLNSLGEESLTTYTRWRTGFEPKKLTKKIISDNIKGNEIGFVSLIDNKIVGYTHLNFKPQYREDVVTEGSLVLLSYSGKGIGSALKKKCVEEAFKQKILKFVAWVHEGNWISFVNCKNNGFLIAGIYFNEEKINKNSNYMISFERPILLKVKQIDYLQKIKSLMTIAKRIPKNLKTKNEKLTFVIFNKNTFFKKSNSKLKHLDLDFKLLRHKITKNNFPLIVILNEKNNPICYGHYDFFTVPEKRHVARILVHDLRKTRSFKAYDLLLSKLVEFIPIYNLEKVWINLPENNSKLFYALINNKFIVEGISFKEIKLKNKSINSISMAYHSKKKISHNIVIGKMEKLIKKSSF